MKKYNLSQIMAAAWRIFRKGTQSFAVALRMAWANAKAHNKAKIAAGIVEETHTWAGGIWVTKSSMRARLCIRQFSATPPPKAAAG